MLGWVDPDDLVPQQDETDEAAEAAGTEEETGA